MLSISTRGTDELTKHFRQIEKKVKNHKVLYKRIGIKILKWVNDNFEAEGIEEKWDELKPQTIARRRKETFKILQDTGRLKGSYTYQSGARKVTIGSAVDYAKYHEPKRPMLPSKELALMMSIQIADNFVKEAIK